MFQHYSSEMLSLQKFSYIERKKQGKDREKEVLDKNWRLFNASYP